MSRRVAPEEIRTAARRLGRAPGYAVAVVVNLALGIGAAAALFTVLEGVILRPLPYPDAERLVVIEHELGGIEMQGAAARFGGFAGQVLLYRERSRQLDAIGLHGSFEATVTSGGEPLYVRTGYASAGYFSALGTTPLAGRLFTADEPSADDDGQGVALLGHALWQQEFGRDSGVVGRRIEVDGYRSEVVGVLPPAGPFPAQAVHLWSPQSDARLRANPGWVVPGIIARLAPGATAASLQRELDTLIPELADRTDDAFVRRSIGDGQLRSRVTPMKAWILDAVGRSIWLLMSAGALLLTVAVVNVTNLALLRADSLRAEIAVRRALGASRSDLAAHHAAEAVLLAAASAGAALGIAAIAVRTLARLGPRDVPRLADVSVGPGTVLLVVLLAALCGAVLVAVAVIGRRAEPTTLALRGTRAAGSRHRRRVHSGLATGEMSLAAALLVVSGLLARSFAALAAVDPGFDAEGLLTFRVPFPLREVQAAGPAGGAATPFYDRLAARLRSIPGVQSVGYGKCLPLASACAPDGLTLHRADLPPPDGGGVMQGIVQAAAGYHATLRIPLLAGRLLEPSDHVERTNALLLSDSVARRLFPDVDPVGMRLVTPDLPSFSPFTVVGVVGDARHADLRGGSEPIVYIPIALPEQNLELWTISYAVRASVPPLSLVHEIRARVRELRPDIPIANVETMTQALERNTAQLRFAMWLLAVAAATALAIGATGVYAVISYAVSMRRREFGVRMALGADGAAVRTLVLRQATITAAFGLAGGAALAVAAGRLLVSQLYEVTATDPLTHLTVCGVLGATALLASAGPAARAARVDPAEVLRGS